MHSAFEGQLKSFLLEDQNQKGWIFFSQMKETKICLAIFFKIVIEFCSCINLSKTFDVTGRIEISRLFLKSVLETFLKRRLQSYYFWSLRCLLKKIEILHSCVVGVLNNVAPSFKNVLRWSLISGTLVSSKFWVLCLIKFLQIETSSSSCNFCSCIHRFHSKTIW